MEARQVELFLHSSVFLFSVIMSASTSLKFPLFLWFLGHFLENSFACWPVFCQFCCFFLFPSTNVDSLFVIVKTNDESYLANFTILQLHHLVLLGVVVSLLSQQPIDNQDNGTIMIDTKLLEQDIKRLEQYSKQLEQDTAIWSKILCSKTTNILSSDSSWLAAIKSGLT